jgi:hypothetical protein
LEEESMRAANILVFDEYLQSGTSSYYTDQSLNDKLGVFDQLALMAVVDNVTSGGTGFRVQIEHSADGRLWPSKNTAAEIAPGGSLGAGQTAYAGGDAGTTPSLAHVRLRIDLGTTTAAHVRVFVTGRNWGR